MSNRKTMEMALEALIGEYWDIAWQEGRDGRTADTQDGAAQKKLSQIQDAIAALSQPAEAQGEPDLASYEVNESCWAFVEAMPHQIPGPIWNALKPEIHAAICKFLKLTHPAAQPVKVPEGWRLVPVELLDDALTSVQDYRAGTEFGRDDRRLIGRLKSAMTAAPLPPAQPVDREPLSEIQRQYAKRYRFAFVESPSWTYAVCKWDGDDWIPIKTAADEAEMDSAIAAHGITGEGV